MAKVFESFNLRSLKVMSPTEAAYVAGFVDGEGTISIDRATRKESRSGFRYQPHFSVSNTHRGVLEAVRDMCGNGRFIQEKRNWKHRDCFLLRLSPNQIRHVLPQLLPFLIVKHFQAEVVLRFLIVKSPNRQLSDTQWLELEGLRAEVRTANLRGRHSVVTPDPPRVIRPSNTGNNQWKKTHGSA